MQDETVYHYTSLETFYHIIDQASNNDITLRATNVDYLNDHTEHLIAIKLLKQKLIEYDKSLDLGNSKGFVELLNDKRMSFFRRKDFEGMYPYIISFSECWDNLPMWNTYANKSNGVALGFSKTKLSDLNDTYRFDKCIYDSTDYEKFLSQKIETLYERTIINSYSIEFDGGLDSDILEDHHYYLPILKNEGFEYEKEYRLIVPHTFNDTEDLKFQPSDGLLKPYKEILIPFDYLTEIVLAPGLNLEKIKSPLALFLRQKEQRLSLNKEDGKIHLRKSEIPYRNI